VGGAGESFGARLRALREDAGLSQEELAEAAGLSVQAVSALERGERRHPYPHTVRALAGALGLSDEERAALAASIPRRGPRTTLPAPPTALRGRGRELEALTALLALPTCRLVTLTGPGGVGKTHLALEFAAAVGHRFADGTTFVSLAPVASPDGVAPAIARALGLREAGDGPPVEALTGFLRERQHLLLLDNFEHVAGAAPVVAELLAGAARLVVLVTSRAPLQVRGEWRFAVEPLPVPASVELFWERAGDTVAGGRRTAADVLAVEQICRRLDGLPLAVELAAARIRLLPPVALLARLDPPLAALESGHRDLPERQRGLRRTVAWSYDLLAPDERALFDRLAVFSGGWSLGAAADVCDVAEPRVVDLHAALLDGSLIARRDEAGEPWFGMLDTVRAFALERLRERAEEGPLRGRHTEHFRAVAVAAAAALAGPDQPAALDQLAREHDNLSAACAALAAGDRPGDLARAAHGLWRYWSIRGHLREGLKWSERALAAPDLRPDEAALAAFTAGTMLFPTGRYAEAGGRLERSAALAREAGDDRLLVLALVARAHVGLLEGRLDVAAPAVDRAVALCAARGFGVEAALAGRCAGNLASAAGDLALADRRLAESEVVLRDRGSPWDVALTLALRGRVQWSAGELVRGRDAVREAVEILASLGDSWTMVQCLSGLAGVAAQQGRPDRAALLGGAAEALRERSGAAVFVAGVAAPDPTGHLAALWTRGRHLALDEIVALVTSGD
jgi:predicted ATPase/transcriptional regulator with XRE-family HTH domain